jgi:P27 family predicted phage terminase small subunit
MGARGPKPQPPALKLVAGNAGRRPIDLDAGINPQVEIPKCPAHLSAEAKTEWKRLSPKLEELGLITALDLAAFAMYCQAYGRWVFAEKRIRELNDQAERRAKVGEVMEGDARRFPGFVQKTPSEYEQQSIWLQVSNKALEQTLKLAAEFGLSPSMRARVTASRELQQKLPGVDPAPDTPTLPEPLSLASFAQH